MAECKGPITQYITSGAQVVTENFLAELVNLPTAVPALQQQLDTLMDRPEVGLAKVLNTALYATGGKCGLVVVGLYVWGVRGG